MKFFDNIPRDRRLSIFLALIAVAFFMAFFYAAQTHAEWKEMKHLNAMVTRGNTAEKTLRDTQTEIQILDRQIRSLQESNSGIRTQVGFIDYLGSLCEAEGMRLVSLPKEQENKLGEYRVSGIRFEMEGDFSNSVKALYRMEQTDKAGSIEQCRIGKESVRTAEGRKDVLVTRVTMNRMMEGKEK